jgi:hypothetical protein
MVVNSSPNISATGLRAGLSRGSLEDRVQLLVVNFQHAHDPAQDLLEDRLACLEALHRRRHRGPVGHLTHGYVT